SVGGGAVACARRMTLRGSCHVFGTIVDHLYRLSGLSCQQGSMTGNYGRILFLPAESSAGLYLNYAYLFGWKIQPWHQGFVNIIRTLHRTPDGDTCFSVEAGDHPLRFYVELLLGASFIFCLDYESRIGPDLIDIPFFQEERLEHVVLSPDDHFFCKG